MPTLKPPISEQNRTKLTRTEPGTSVTTGVRTWLGILFKECTRTVHHRVNVEKTMTSHRHSTPLNMVARYDARQCGHGRDTVA